MKKISDKKDWIWLLFFPLTVIYLEMLLKAFCVGSATWRTILFTVLFSLAFGFFLTVLTAPLGARFRFWSTLSLSVLLFLYFAVQTVYYELFKIFATISISSMAGDAITNFWRDMLYGIAVSLPKLLLMALPTVLWAVFGKKLSPEKVSARFCVGAAALFAAFHAAGCAGALSCNEGIMSPRYLYTDGYVADLCTAQFGSLSTIRLEIRNLLLPDLFAEDEPEPTPTPTATAAPTANPNPSGEVSVPDDPQPTPEVTQYGDNVLEIDFDALLEGESNSTLRDMHEYFSKAEPTKQNEYSGMFAGKNLVWIVAEAFSSWAIDETVTPTLHKMANNGFVFNNFYCPLWYCSTTGGEYVTMTGLLTPGSTQMFARSAGKYMPFGFGNLMAPKGYSCYAWHNGSYTYYSRNETHANMGYDFRAIDAGLELDDPYIWPASDEDMLRHTVGEYAYSGEPFSVYYMTISGHMNYGYSYQAMCARHRDKVEHLDYTPAAKAYLACQIELDLAMQTLLETLEDAGVADDTLIVISADHYPYGLDIKDIESLAGGDVEENFELYRSTLIMYCPGMEENVYVDKYCSSLDVMPTLANLFGLEYDSRLVMGRDVFSDSEALVIFGNKSFITEKGRYNAFHNAFTPNEGADVSDSYARDTLKKVQDMFKYSEAIINNDYYRVVLG